MNDIFFGNLRLIANSTMWFTQKFGIDNSEFIEAITGITMVKIHEFYKNKGVEFDMETVKLEEDAMLYVYDHIMKIADLAHMAAALGITPEDLQK